MAIWPVNIVGDPATFVAPLQPNSAVGTVYAAAGDIVFWNNTTAQNHKISVLAAAPSQGEVTPGHQTDAFQVAGNSGTTIAYNCVLHPLETGRIIVT
jgi:plastocyanin